LPFVSFQIKASSTQILHQCHTNTYKAMNPKDKIKPETWPKQTDVAAVVVLTAEWL